ncbi:TonB-dependent receptor [Novosphingobium resinovorum]|uniref:TonB-dependent receptor n=1 Tax=Novosphingobium resinovorum TaxID=158500 RepID=UPI002ECFD2C8|nr:TonB-dependent receptor [Novosphingobium resinovorum]
MTLHSTAARAAVAVTLALALPSTAAWAEDAEAPGSGPIIVTGKVEDVLPQQPASRTRIQADTIEQARIQTVQDVAALLPNTLLADQGSPRFSINTMRGIGNTIRNDYFNSTIGLYVDGVPLPSAEFSRRLVDVESIDVQRGPSGTTQGRFSLGGTINVRTKQPTNDFEGAIEGTVGNQDQLGLGASLSGPIVKDALYARAYADYSQVDGFIDDAAGKNIDGRKSFSTGGSLRFERDPSLRVTIAGDYQRDHVGAYAFLPYDDYRTRDLAIDAPNDELRHSGGLSGTIDYDMGGARLTSVTAWRKYSVRARQDLAYSPDVVTYGGGHTDSDEDGWQVSQELRLSSSQDAGRLLKWTIGAYYQYDRVVYDYLFDMPAFGAASNYVSRYDREEIAGFGEITLALPQGLDLTAGLRVAHDTDKLDANTPFKGSTDATMLTPRFQASWHIDAERMIYASATRGARSGGFSRLASSPGAFDPEYLWQYEAGLRSTWLDRKLALNATLFRIDWTDQQITQIVSTGESRTTNAGKSRSQGVEFEAVAFPIPGLELSGRLGFIKAEYDRYIDASGVDLSGNRMVNTPSMTAGASLQYRTPIGGEAVLVTRWDYERVGSHYFDAGNSLHQSAYDLVNARVGVELGRVSASLFARNLFDKKYRAYGFTDSFGYDVAIVGQRRLVGATVKVAFQ